MKRCTATLAIILVSLVTFTNDAAAGGARIWPGKRSATTEGTVTLGVPPVTAYAVVTDYRRWTYLFSDVKTVALESGGADDGSVRFTSRALGHTVIVRFDNERWRVIRFRLTDGPAGARAWGEYILQPTPDGRGTIVRATLYMDAVGVVGWLVRDKTIRGKRERKLRTDLEDLARRFPPLT